MTYSHWEILFDIENKNKRKFYSLHVYESTTIIFHIHHPCVRTTFSLSLKVSWRQRKRNFIATTLISLLFGNICRQLFLGSNEASLVDVVFFFVLDNLFSTFIQ